MIIGDAGPCSAEINKPRSIHLDTLNAAEASVLGLGPIQLIGMDAAVPVLEQTNSKGR
ncbi:hypothetical protein EMGBS15_01910 [Filimonas sp.]|nr:hypothetical protein EMGBS15_01910 [Filimonas sp.]